MEPNTSRYEGIDREQLELRLTTALGLNKRLRKKAAKTNARNIDLNVEIYALKRQVRIYELNYQMDDNHARKLALAEERLSLISELAKESSGPRRVSDITSTGPQDWEYRNIP